MKKLKELRSDEAVKNHISFLKTRLLKMGLLLSIGFGLMSCFFSGLYFRNWFIGLGSGLGSFIILTILFLGSSLLRYDVVELEIVEKKGPSVSGRVKDIGGKWFDVSEGVLFDKIELNKPTIFYVSGSTVVDLYEKSIYDVE